MSDRKPCPDCGGTETLETLRYRVFRAKQAKKEHEDKVRKEEAERRQREEEARIRASGGAGGTGGCVVLGISAMSSINAPGNLVLGDDNHHISIGPSTSERGSISILDPPTDIEIPDWDEFRANLTGRVNGMECCTGCGRFYHPYFHLEKQQLIDDEIEVYGEFLHPLEMLAREAGNDSAGD